MTNEKLKHESSFDLELRFYCKNLSKGFAKQKNIVQGEPFEWGVEIKNIGNKPSPEGKITEAQLRDLNESYFQYMEQDEITFKSLNPQESVKILLDKTTIFLEGVQWAEVFIEPKDSKCVFKTYQYEIHHDKTVAFSDRKEDLNRWMEAIYIQKRSELLQARTNQYILLLTIITVWESIFGLGNTLKIISATLAKALTFIASFLTYLSSISW